jgi:hypothetical protein
MTRLYYTDPLAAAWMAKHHGVSLYTGSYPDDFDAYSYRNWMHCQDDYFFRLNQQGTRSVFYIKPDSMPLFNAMPGDVVMIANGNEAHRINVPCALSPGERIVERHGLAFIWPESK